MKPAFRIGLGYDIHRFASGRKLILGGVEIPSDKGLDGHSDADALTHAIADAILGAIGEPDIGYFFPPDSPACEGINSQIILERAVQEAERKGFSVVNVDCMIIAETPKIGPYRDAMQATLADTLRVDEECVNIKATTNERLGALGAGEGLAAQAVCLLQKP